MSKKQELEQSKVWAKKRRNSSKKSEFTQWMT